jgi:TRAP-type mannitol/chloroaromatic compound transport system permease large subunit
VLAGYPVAFTLAGVGLVFATLGIVLGVFDVAILSALVGRYFGTMTNETLVAVPLFGFMGVMLEKSRLADDLLDVVGHLAGGLRGGISVALALSLPEGEARDVILTVTYMVVVFSVLVQGLTLGPLVRAMAARTHTRKPS